MRMREVSPESRMPARLALVVEADSKIQRRLTAILRDSGYEAVHVPSVDEAIEALARRRFVFSVVASTLDGLEALRRLASQGGEPGPIIMIVNEHDGTRIPEATALGAADFVRTPFGPEDVEHAIKKALSRPHHLSAVSAPGQEAANGVQQEIALWCSPKMRALWDIIQQAAGVDVTVLIGGETGTGKDVVARAIHVWSSRRAEPFVKVNCAAVPRELLETELFGHERGAFTGAHQLKVGKFEAANRGTLLLDEIGDLHPALQAKLLHVLQDGTFSRVGGKAPVKADVRVLAATNRDLERAVAEGRFREDLYYRLDVIQIVVPPLRERIEEIPRLAQHFVQRYAQLFHRPPLTITPAVMDRLMRYRYPGNVRELENLIKRMIVLGDPEFARTPFPSESPGEPSRSAPDPAPGLVVSLKDVARQAALAAEREAISRVLAQTGWNRVRTAKSLQISYRALLYKIKAAGLAPKRPAARAGL